MQFISNTLLLKFIFNGIFLIGTVLCLRTQLAMSISPQDLNFEINVLNIREITIIHNQRIKF